MTSYHWPTVRDDAIRKFSDTPRADTEQRILEAFEHAPRQVIVEIDKLAERVANGTGPRSPWAVLAKTVGPLASSGAPVTAADTSERDAAIRRAEAWIRNVGHQFDHEDRAVAEEEFADALFGFGGLLREYADEDLLRRRMVDRWRENYEAAVRRRQKEVAA